MLAKNLDANNVITIYQIGWSLWLAVASTGGFMIAIILFCIHRINLGSALRGGVYSDSKYIECF
jgi:hypothetical protein